MLLLAERGSKTVTERKGTGIVVRVAGQAGGSAESPAPEVPDAEAFHRLTDILRCKWTIAVIDAIDRGVCRPGHIQKELRGLTAKILNERVRKLTRYGLIVKESYPEIPPHVEYRFTARGRQLVKLIRTMRDFAQTWEDAAGPTRI